MSGMTPDQVIEAKHVLSGFAEILSCYYKDLRKQGFSKGQAMALVIAYQRSMTVSSE
jgi:hypothetical protein